MADVQLGHHPQLHQHLAQHAAQFTLRSKRTLQVAVRDLARLQQHFAQAQASGLRRINKDWFKGLC
ncbi:hypothetical protein SDC9_160984 [bioreactor metagenome]|uniref:Uncharacterized protein n=1 Tax=bioreactor metagenome TaxID=1076179 RepID=A0A645FH07_9ZZZZ